MKNFRTEKYLQGQEFEKEVEVNLYASFSINTRFKGIIYKAQDIWLYCNFTCLKHKGARKPVKLPSLIEETEAESSIESFSFM